MLAAWHLDRFRRSARDLIVLGRKLGEAGAEDGLAQAGILREARQAFLLRLSDALRPLAGAAAIQEAATRILGEHLDADRTYYVEIDEARQVATVARDYVRGSATSLAGDHPMAPFGSMLEVIRTGRPFIADDVEATPAIRAAIPACRALSLRAFVSMPLVKDGVLVATMCVVSGTPRRWTGEDVALLEETAERTWAAVERARAEAALRASEERFRGFAENSADVLWIADAAGTRLDYLSPAFERVFGEPRGAVLADLGRVRELVQPEDLAAFDSAMPRTVAGETVLVHYRVVRPADGRTIYLRDTGFPVRGPDGAVRQIAGIVQDITDLVAAGAALQAEKERFRVLAEGMPQLVWRAVGHGLWTWASPQWTAFTGLSDEDSRGLGWLAALHPADRERALAAWEGAGADGLLQAEYRIRHAGTGYYTWFQTRGVPVANGRGGVAEWLGTSTDIDAQVSTREALARSQEQLEARVAERTAELMAAEATLRQAQKMDAVGRLTGGIAHDFNNMLQAIGGALELARRRTEQGRPAEAARHVENARDTVRRAAALTHRLLAFARQQTLAPAPVRLDELVMGMAEMIRRTVGPEIQVEVRLGDGTWPVLCDESQIENVLLNLCVNARDAMAQGGWLTISTGEVTLTEADLAGEEGLAPGAYAVVAVADTGTGMDEATRARVFEPFFTTKPLGQGTGLGLSQAYGFVRQSGGLVRLDSAPGEGTTVRIFLPRHEAEAARDDAAVPAVVLLVEDEDGLRAMAAEWLREAGYRVLEAQDGAAAMRLLHGGEQLDLLVTDVGLPGGLNGRQVAEAARALRPELPVLLVTGYAGGALRGAALPAGMAVLDKPFALGDLAARVRAMLEAAAA